ncbi:hypothetical protein [Streptomyces venezuelae]|uniref:hypothetical protein n=1 Tax=Streptomyces venezuelae TaxID=54571 RepID=UPI00278C75AD|nr:hypothetical protein [Streptomyces venezuelae]
MDFFDGELGGRDETHIGAENRGCSWFSAILIGFVVLAVVVWNWFWDALRGLLF